MFLHVITPRCFVVIAMHSRTGNSYDTFRAYTAPGTKAALKLFLPSTCCYKLLCVNAKPTFNDLDLSFTYWSFSSVFGTAFAIRFTFLFTISHTFDCVLCKLPFYMVRNIYLT